MTTHFRRLSIELFGLLAGLVIAVAAASGAQNERGTVITGKVTAVSDGDTFTLENGQRIRLFGVDAPELAHAIFGIHWGQQPYAIESRDTLKSLVLGNTVKCTVISKSYDRYVCTVMVGTKDVSEEMVKAGAAWVEPRYNKSQALRDAQEKAKAAGKGLWGQGSPIEPWLWRKGGK